MDVSVSESINPQHNFSTQLNHPQRYKLGEKCHRKEEFSKLENCLCCFYRQHLDTNLVFGQTRKHGMLTWDLMV